jgi:hypothetical protein
MRGGGARWQGDQIVLRKTAQNVAKYIHEVEVLTGRVSRLLLKNDQNVANYCETFAE